MIALTYFISHDFAFCVAVGFASCALVYAASGGS